MNKIYFLLYAVLQKLIYLNLKFKYIPVFHIANFLSSIVKMEIQSVFCKTAKVSPMELWDVIKVEGMIDLLTVITMI